MHPKLLQELFELLSGPLVLYARGWCDYPDDAVQEAFIDLANCSSDPKSPHAWLYTTTRRKAQNIARSEHRRRRHQRRAGEQADHWFRDSSLSTEWLPEDVAAALQQLSSDQREVVVARVWGELSFEQLAEVLDCSLSSAHRRYSAALKQLESLLSIDAGQTQLRT